MNPSIIEIIENNDQKKAAEIINGIIYSKDRLIWLLKNVGKTVWPDSLPCTCGLCGTYFDSGYILCDIQMACDLHIVEQDCTADGKPIKFYLSKAERDRVVEERNNQKQMK